MLRHFTINLTYFLNMHSPPVMISIVQLSLSIPTTSMMLAYCCIKPVNGAKLHEQIAYIIGQNYILLLIQPFYDLNLQNYENLFCLPEQPNCLLFSLYTGYSGVFVLLPVFYLFSFPHFLLLLLFDLSLASELVI